MNDIRTFEGTLQPVGFGNAFVQLLDGGTFTRVNILESWLDLDTSGGSPSMPYSDGSNLRIVVERDGDDSGPLLIKGSGLGQQSVKYFLRLEIIKS